MKRILFILLFCLSFSAFSQMWFYPSSEWYYSRSWPGANGYLKINYTGTVSINNYTLQQLQCYNRVYYGLFNSIGTSTTTYYTYESDSVVYLYHSMNNNFDTLYNYKAKIGDSWLIPRNTGSCPRYTVHVTDTGHHLIQGQNLKWLKIDNFDTLYERIGMMYIFAMDDYNECNNIDYVIGGPLRCYSDHQISNYKKYSNSCDYINAPIGTGLIELQDPNNIKIYPNPVFETLFIETENNELDELQIANMKGQVLMKHFMSDKNSINVSSLANGIYLINLFSKRKLVSTRKIVVIK